MNATHSRRAIYPCLALTTLAVAATGPQVKTDFASTHHCAFWAAQ